MLKGNRAQPKQVHFIEVNPSKRNIMSTNHYRVDTSFQFAIWPVLAAAQCFCMMPLSGVRCKDLEYEKATARLRFRWRSLRVVWTLAYLGFGTCLTYLYFDRLTDTGVTAKNIGLLFVNLSNNIYFYITIK